MPYLTRTLLLSAAFMLGLGFTASARPDEDPVYDGKKSDVWAEILKLDTSARKRALAATALGELRAKHRVKDLHKDLGRSLRVDKSSAVRAQCAIAIGGLPVVDIKEIDFELVEAIKEEKDSRVRKELSTLFGRYPEFAKRAVPGLSAILKDPDAEARTAAADALSKLGSGAKDAANDLLPLLGDSDKAARQAGIFAIGRVSPDNPSFAAAALLKRFGEEKEHELRREIIVSLKLLGDKSEATVNGLARALQDPEDDVKSAAAVCLGTFGTPARPAVEALFKLATTSKDKGLRIDSLRAFGSALGPDVKGRLKDVIGIMENDVDFEVRLAAVEEVASLGMELKDDKETMAALRKRLSDPQVKVREAAAIAIRRIERKPDPKPKDKKP